MCVVLMFIKSFWEHMTDLWGQYEKPNKKQRCELPPLTFTVCYSKSWDPVAGCLKTSIQFNTVSKDKNCLTTDFK